MNEPLTILGTGDVGARRADLDSMFTHVAPLLRGGDISFGQLETVVTDRGAMAPNARLAMRAPSEMAAATRRAGYDVMSFAGNHCLDWGYEGLSDTLDHMAAAGVGLCGAGQSLTEARAPIFLEAKGRRIAFVAASSILPEGYAARDDKPGCAPMRAHTLYEQVEHDQPGTPARTITRAVRADLDALTASIRAARAEADHVILSIHWGIHMVRGSLADYQREVAHAAIAAGADAILGHHPHILKGIELIDGKPVFYSLGNFAIEQPHVWDPSIVHTASFRHLVSLNPNWDFESSYMLPEETRLTGIARLRFDGDRIDAAFLPCWIGDDAAPRLLAAGDPLHARVRDYLIAVSAEEGLSIGFAAEGDALRLIRSAAER